MALSAMVTKNIITVANNGTYHISANLILFDDDVEVVYQNFCQIHNPANNISVARDMLLKKIQTVINNYKKNKFMRDGIVFADVIAYINSKLEV